MTKQIFEKANQPKEFWEVEGMDHFPKRDPEMLAKLVTRVAEFFENNLK